MFVIRYFFRAISILITLYTLLCIVRILITWIPGASYSKFARFLSKVCDPYLNLFHGMKFLVLGSFDFSPAVALCILFAASSFASRIGSGGSLSVGTVLGLVLTLAWTIVSSVLSFLLILFIVRVILLAVHKPSYQGSLLDQIDRSITPLAYRIADVFKGKKNISYKEALIIASVVIFLLLVLGTFIVTKLSKFVTII